MLRKLVFSPYPYWVIALLIPLVGVLCSPHGYYSIFGEKKYISADVIYYTFGCFVMFTLGFSIPFRLVISKRWNSVFAWRMQNGTSSRWLTVFAWLITCINIFVLIRFFALVGFSGLIQAFIDGRFVTGGIRGAYDRSVSGVSWIITGAPAIFSVMMWTRLRTRRALSAVPIAALLLSSLARAAVKGDVGQIVLYLFIAAVLYIWFRGQQVIRSLALLLGFLVVGLFVFTAFQASRGKINTILDAPRQVFAYYIGSYNRFGVQLELQKPLEASQGYYTLSPLRDIPVVSQLVDTNQLWTDLTRYAPPTDPYAVWANFGIETQFNVITAFGYTYLDWGVAGVLVFFFYGVLMRTAWASFRRQGVLGVALFPAMLWTLTELRGKLEVTYYNFTCMVILAVLYAALNLIRLPWFSAKVPKIVGISSYSPPRRSR